MFAIVFIVTGLVGWICVGVTKQFSTIFIRSQPYSKKWLWLIAIICLISIGNNAFEYPFSNEPNHRSSLIKEWEQGTKFEANTKSNISLTTPLLLEIWLYTKDLYRLVGFFIAGSLEEFGRFGILVLFLLFGKRFKLRLFLFAQIFIGIWFSLCHDYINTSHGLAFISAHIFAFLVSIIFVDIGIRYGILAAYLCHVLVNFLDLNILLHSSTILIWLNLVIAFIAFYLCFYILRRIEVNPAWLKLQGNNTSENDTLSNSSTPSSSEPIHHNSA
ncbi:MAG: hypothetical protein ACRCYY_13750 [Trueperaceae bacterium]